VGDEERNAKEMVYSKKTQWPYKRGDPNVFNTESLTPNLSSRFRCVHVYKVRGASGDGGEGREREKGTVACSLKGLHKKRKS